MSGGLIEGALASAIASTLQKACEIGLQPLADSPTAAAWLRERGVRKLEAPADATFQAAYVYAYSIVAVDRHFPASLLGVLQSSRSIEAAIAAVRAGGAVPIYQSVIEKEVRETKAGDRVVADRIDYVELCAQFLVVFTQGCEDTENPAQARIRQGVAQVSKVVDELAERQRFDDASRARAAEEAQAELKEWNTVALEECPLPPAPAYDHALYHCTAAASLANFADECRRIELHSLMEVSSARRRLFAVAPGGYGKSSLICRIAPELAKEGPLIVIRADDCPKDVEIDSDAKLLMLAPGGPTWMDFARLGESSGCAWVLVDGLNQWAQQTQTSVVDILGALTTKWKWVRCLATTRENQEIARANGWHFLRLSELSDQNVSAVLAELGQQDTYERLLDSTKRILRIPFYLDLFARNPTEDRTRVAMISAFFGLDSDQVTAELGWKYLDSDPNASQASQTTCFFDTLRAEKPELHRNMVERGTLEVAEGRSDFTHHLHRDFFAANAVASDPTRWDDKLFDLVTLDGSSADALVLALELVGRHGVEHADRFVDAVYDWNYAIAIEIIEDVELVSGHSPVSKTVAVAIWMAQAVKLLDPVPQTRARARARLLNYRSQMAGRLAEIVDVVSNTKLLECARALVPSSVNSTWGAFFFRPSEQCWSEDDVNMISHGSSIVGWTVSNVLRRSRPDESALRQLRTLGIHASPTVRWRVAHALGSHASNENLEFLLVRVEVDESRWVQYGAARAACEVAVGVPAKAADAARRLQLRAADLDWLVLREIGASVFVDGCLDVPGWLSSWKAFFESRQAVAPIGSVGHRYWSERIEEVEMTLGGGLGEEL